MAVLRAQALCHVIRVQGKNSQRFEAGTAKATTKVTLKEPLKHHVYFYSLAHGGRSRVAKTKKTGGKHSL